MIYYEKNSILLKTIDGRVSHAMSILWRDQFGSNGLLYALWPRPETTATVSSCSRSAATVPATGLSGTRAPHGYTTSSAPTITAGSCNKEAACARNAPEECAGSYTASSACCCTCT